MFKVQDCPKSKPEDNSTTGMKPKADCPLCKGKGYMDINNLGVFKADCTCKYK